MLLSHRLSTGFYNILDQVPEPCAELLYRPIELSENTQRLMASRWPECRTAYEAAGNAVAAVSAPFCFVGAVFVFGSLCLNASFTRDYEL